MKIYYDRLHKESATLEVDEEVLINKYQRNLKRYIEDHDRLIKSKLCGLDEKSIDGGYWTREDGVLMQGDRVIFWNYTK